jgi:AcrR family transcriptional regulator
MEAGEDLWPPFGPGAGLRPGQGRGEDRRGPGPDRDRRGPGGDRGDRRQQQSDRDAQRHAGQRQRGEPPPRRMLSQDDIVAAAIGIADRFGSEAISMRKIAQVLHAGAMSLYWHLAGKEHLIELMVDAINGEVYVPEPTGDWQADLRTQAMSTRDVLRRHPWVVDFSGSRPPLGPQTLGMLDRMLSIFDLTDVDLETAIVIFQIINTYVSGAVVREFQELRTQREQEEFVAENADFHAKLLEWKDRLAGTGRFRHFLQMLEDNIDPDGEETRDQRFQFGLDCLIEGIAVKVAGGTGWRG